MTEPPPPPAGESSDRAAGHGRTADAPPWYGTGLGAPAGRVLEFLVTHPQSAVADAAAATGMPAAAVGRVLRKLEADLLAVRVTRRPVRWSASPPRPALGSLLARRREELARLETFADSLHAAYTSGARLRLAGDQFEVLETGEQLTARYTHLLRTSTREVLHLVMPPYVAALDEVPERLGLQAESIRSGVSFRSVYDADTLVDGVSLETARRGVAIGGRVRLAGRLPMKLVLFDGVAAIMPLRLDDPAAGSLVVHWPTLLQVLEALFESLWEHGVPLSAGQEPVQDGPAVAPPVRGGEPDERTREVLRLMSLGMKDDAIARVLGLSRRTIQKHVSDIGIALGARTRFQIALLARERGWLGPPSGAMMPGGEVHAR